MRRISAHPAGLRPCWWLPVILIILAASPCGATVLTGPIVDLPEWTVPYAWGDGTHQIFQQWSVYLASEAGYFYGSSQWSLSNADVFVYHGLTDPTTITDADTLAYSTEYVTAHEGDCVFFRGTNRYYGVWRIDAIDPLPGPGSAARLSGQWYFQNDGTGDFSFSPTGVTATAWGAVKALYR